MQIDVFHLISIDIFSKNVRMGNGVKIYFITYSVNDMLISDLI